MFRRMLCLLCAALLLFYSFPALSASAVNDISYDFDLSFYLNADSFPELLRARTAGYASLVNRLGLRGNISVNTEAQSFDLDATLFYTDDSSLTYPFRIYGVKSRVFITSPLIGNEVILLNMGALMEFSIKAKNTLGLPLPYFALLIPYTTESGLSGLTQAWQDVIGARKKSRKISAKKIRKLSGLWTDELLKNNYLRFWIAGVAGGADVPEAVELEMNSLPGYLDLIAGGQPVSVSVAHGSETWRDAAGNTLFSCQESDGAVSSVLSLPASANGYIPSFSSMIRQEDQTVSFDIDASVRRDAEAESAVTLSPSAEESWDEYGYETYDDYDDYDDEYGYETDDGNEEYGAYEDPDRPARDLPETLLKFRLNGSGFPCEYPADSAFALSVSVQGAVYPNYTFCLSGETKKDGTVALSLSKPFSGNDEPVEIFRCAGSLHPAAEPKEVPDYLKVDMFGSYNVFSFNEQKLGEFTDKVLPPLVRSVFSFVAAAPTSACQSFLDDLTDMGVLDMLLE